MAYLVMTGPAGMPSEAFATMLGDLQARGWQAALSVFGLAVLTKGGRPPEVTGVTHRFRTDGVVIGRIFDRQPDASGRPRRTDLEALAERDPVEACEHLCAHAFGGYVVVLAKDRSEPTVLRSPSGMIDAFTWRAGPISFVGDDIPVGLAAPEDLAVDWCGVEAVLARPVRSVARAPLSGVSGLDPGVCRSGPYYSDDKVLWTPARIARRGPIVASHEDLRATIDLAIGAELDEGDRVLTEISGGLDSAIVATSLAASGRPAVGAVNFWRDQAEADERRYAQAVASRAGVPLTSLHRDLMSLDAAAFEVSARAVRPNLAAADPGNDHALADALKRADAGVLMTGHGGDVVLFQIAAVQLAAELLRGAPCRGSRAGRLADIARRARRSVWSLAWESLTGRTRTSDGRPPVSERDFIRALPDAALHPWTEDHRGVSPARRLQIEGLVNSLDLVAQTRRADVARISHPLLSQPVVELCLQIPAPILSSGEGERSFAREAFAERLPPQIVQRRSKGDVTTYFGRSMAANLPFIREYLLDGRLVSRGLIDRRRLEAVLSPDALVRLHIYGDLLFACGLEAWIGHWEGRSAVGVGGGAGPIVSARNEKARA